MSLHGESYVAIVTPSGYQHVPFVEMVMVVAELLQVGERRWAAVWSG